MERPTLNALERDEAGKGPARRLRASGRVPAVVYGEDMDTVSLSLDALEAQHLFQAISVENTIVQLAVGDDEPLQTLVREIQTHPHRPDLVHVDFLHIQAGKAVEVSIPIRLNGVPEGVRTSGGVLEQIFHELPVKCIPSKIPESIEIDVTDLEINEAVHVYDVELGEDVTVLLDPQRTICTVVVPKVIEVEEEEPEEGEVLLVGEEGEELPEGAEPEAGAEEAGDEEADEGGEED